MLGEHRDAERTDLVGHVAAGGNAVGADNYDRDLTDIFEIQDEISKAIVDALQVKLLPQEKSAIESRGTTNVDAYNLYLMARQQWIAGTYGDPRRDEAIVRFCHQATLLDPDYAEAWALMALAQAELRFWHAKGDEKALPAAERTGWEAFWRDVVELVREIDTAAR